MKGCYNVQDYLYDKITRHVDLKTVFIDDMCAVI